MWSPIVLVVLGCSKQPEEGPLEGPGFDEKSGAFLGQNEEYLVAITHLQVKNAPGPGGRFGDHADAVGSHLFETEPAGWMGGAFRNVGRLQWWTLTVWESEEAMNEWVLSKPHVEAMVAIDDVSSGSSLRSLWLPAEQMPLPWDQALDLLAEAPDVEYGEPKWPEDG